MSTKTKILVFKMKEIIYTIVFAVLAILLIIFLVLIIKGHSKKAASQPKNPPFLRVYMKHPSYCLQIR